MSAASTRDFVIAEPGLAHVTVASDHDLLRELVRTIGFGRIRAPRWSHVGACLGHGAGVSQAICRALDLEPHELVGDDLAEDEDGDFLVPVEGDEDSDEDGGDPDGEVP